MTTKGDCRELRKWLVTIFLLEIAWPTTVYSDYCKYTSPTTLVCHGITAEHQLETLDVTKLENIKTIVLPNLVPDCLCQWQNFLLETVKKGISLKVKFDKLECERWSQQFKCYNFKDEYQKTKRDLKVKETLWYVAVIITVLSALSLLFLAVALIIKMARQCRQDTEEEALVLRPQQRGSTFSEFLDKYQHHMKHKFDMENLSDY